MFKLKYEQKRPIIRDGEDVSGHNALKLPVGTYLRVLQTSHSNRGDIIVRWPEESRPFRTVRTGDRKDSYIGNFWGTSLEDYYFSIMYGLIPEDFPEYQDILNSET
jgi:hypothetical protein